VITEYAWDAASCDPCPGPTLDYGDFATLGADELGGGKGKVEPYQGAFVLTRLHARYGKSITDDLVFKAAEPIVGGREFLVDGKKLEERSRPDSMNNFQGRYAIRHAWTGPIACANPVRGRWGGPPAGVAGNTSTKAATDLAFAPRGKAQIASMVRVDIPEIDVKAAGVATPTPTGATPSPTGAKPDAPKKKSGCGCAGGTGEAGAMAMLGFLALGFVTRRRRVRS
jgi:MYXO-CTERM domain-containing protein